VTVRFAPFVVNPQTRQVLRDHEEIHLSNKAFDLLCALIDGRPDVLPKEELLRLVWPDTHVVEANLNVLIGEIRRALGDDPQHPQYIRTVHGVGYAFSAEATADDRSVRSRSVPTSRFWIMWKQRTFLLTEGDNLIGRHPECAIWLDEAGVSRRHARIHVNGSTGTAVLEDLNSTNGTYAGRAPVVAPHPLADGDVIQVGSVELTFRAWSANASRETKRIRRKPR